MKKEKNVPPRLPLKLLKWFCKPAYHVDIEGDLLELYKKRVEKLGRRKANRLLFNDVLLLFRPGIIKSYPTNSKLNYFDMFGNHLKITWRNLVKKKATSLFGISGLALGLACTIGIFLWVSYEMSFNRFHQKSEQLFLVELLLEGWENSVVTPSPLASSLAAEYPEILKATRYSYFNDGMLVTVKDKQMMEKGAKVDPSFFEMFDFKLKEGAAKSFEGNQIILTEKTATKYFGHKDPIGEVVTLNDEESFIVSAILENVPQNSSFQFDFLIPFEPVTDPNWGAWFCATFIQMDKKADPQDFLSATSGFKTFYNKINKPKWSSELVAIPDLYFHDKMTPFFPHSGDIKLVWIFSITGVLIFVLSCLNYISLSTSRFVVQFKQIGLEKLLGAGRWQVSHKYFAEAFVHTVLALTVATLLLLFFQRNLTALNIQDIVAVLRVNKVTPAILGIAIAMIFLNTLIPTIVSASIKPIALLKNTNHIRPSGISLRRALVIFQFCISICMIIGMLVFQKQLTFIQNKDLGYQKDHVLSIRLNHETSKTFPVLKNKLLQHVNILNVSQNTFEYVYFDIKISDWEGKNMEGSITVRPMTADQEFVKTFNIEMVAGRFYDSRQSDNQSLVINQEAARAMGISSPVGKKVRLPGEKKDRTIIGVVKDFNYWGLTKRIEPLFIFNGKSGNVYVSMKEKNVDETLSFIEATFKNLNPNYPMDYVLLADRYNSQHASYQKAGKIFRVFGIIAMVVSCLSLLAMITFTVEQKTKEIGIRKVNGASFWNIIRLLLKDFMQYLSFAFILAIPITWFAMDKWLQIFAYRINISIEQFLVGGTIIVLAALLTTTFHAVKAALANPIHALRNE